MPTSIFLIEDCAHAHGASWNGRRAGTWGDAGIWSFAATKTISTGEGGMLVSRHDDLIAHAREFRNYGKPSYETFGLNFRMNEFTAARRDRPDRAPRRDRRLEERRRARASRPAAPGRLELPEGMVSSLYKYIVFDPIERSTGKVYDEPCHRIMGHETDLPVSDWIATNHWCVPLYYRPVEADS